MSEAYWKARAEQLEAALQEAMGWNWLDDNFYPPEDVVQQCYEALAPPASTQAAERDPAKGPLNSRGDYYGVCPRCERSLEEYTVVCCPSCDVETKNSRDE